MFRMSTRIQDRLIRLLARKNRHQHLALRVMLAKVIAKSALSTMNRLHKNLPVSSSECTRCLVGDDSQTLRRRKPLVNCGEIGPAKSSESNELCPARGW